MSVSEKIGLLFNSMTNIIVEKRVLIAVCLVIFFVIGIVFYYKYIKPKLNNTYADNREFITKNKSSSNDPSSSKSSSDLEDNIAILYFFYTDWCPLSKKALPEWNAFKEDTNGSFDGVSVSFQEVDCDKETDIADNFNIVGYPTIKLEYKNKTYEYDAKPDRKILNKFLTDIFNNP
jgi:thiol-disulfide isomerase/thioredoxin